MSMEEKKMKATNKGNNKVFLILAVVLGAAVAVMLIATVLLFVMPGASAKGGPGKSAEKISAEEMKMEPEDSDGALTEIKTEIVVTANGAAGAGDDAEAAQTENGGDGAAEAAGNTDHTMLDFTASASSTLEASDYDYDASNLMDGDASTCWADGDSGDGTGESITFTSDAAQTVTGLAILPGYCKSGDLYGKNGVPKTLTIEYAGETMEYTFDDSVLVYNSSDPLAGTMYIDFGSPAEISECKVTISAVRDGNKYDDCCISEMYLY